MGYIRTPIYKIFSKYDLYISPITGTATTNPGTGPPGSRDQFCILSRSEKQSNIPRSSTYLAKSVDLEVCWTALVHKYMSSFLAAVLEQTSNVVAKVFFQACLFISTTERSSPVKAQDQVNHVCMQSQGRPVKQQAVQQHLHLVECQGMLFSLAACPCQLELFGQPLRPNRKGGWGVFRYKQVRKPRCQIPWELS